MSPAAAVKETIKQLTPEAVWHALHQWRHGQKCYWTWSGASRAAGSYDSDMLNRFRIARGALGSPPFLSDDHPLSRAIRPLAHQPSVQVTDLGGGTGDALRGARQNWPAVQAVVVEHPGLVKLMAPEPGLSWASSIPAVCDVFFTGGTLQYLADPYRQLDRGFASAKHAVVMTRNSFCERRLIRVQQSRLYDNGAGPIPPGFSDHMISFPHQTISESRVHRLAAKHGFRLTFSASESSGVQQYRGMVYGKQMLFLRGPR